MIDIVLGGQFGSEGKGSVVSWFVEHDEYDLVIRTGGSQAGHTFVYDGKLYKMRMLPCAWHADIPMAISRQAVVNEDVLLKEILTASQVIGIDTSELPLYIHPNATLLTADNSEQEKAMKLDVRLGSTLEGVGASRASRIFRTASTASCSTKLRNWVRDYKALITPNSKVLVESTQGWGLSLFGDYYPYTTSADITPYAILADAGVPFGSHKVSVIGVLRTFPIRVGGNSGPLTTEVTWDWLRRTFGQHIPDEHTTVTGRLRRVGLFDQKQAQQFCSECHPNEIFLTFCDYISPELAEQAEGVVHRQHLHRYLQEILTSISPVTHLGVGIGKFVRLRS